MEISKNKNLKEDNKLLNEEISKSKSAFGSDSIDLKEKIKFEKKVKIKIFKF